MNVIDFRSELERRERYIIVLARALQEEFANSDPLDTEPWQPALSEIATEISDEPLEDFEFRYRDGVAFFMTKPGAVINTEAFEDPAPHHRACLEWARSFIARVECKFGVRLLDQPRRAR